MQAHCIGPLLMFPPFSLPGLRWPFDSAIISTSWTMCEGHLHLELEKKKIEIVQYFSFSFRNPAIRFFLMVKNTFKSGTPVYLVNLSAMFAYWSQSLNIMLILYNIFYFTIIVYLPVRTFRENNIFPPIY